jgi:Zn-finger nucleic acid-binding protein
LARVSDKARYCHHCAASLFTDNIAGEKSDLHCPICDSKRKLVSRRFGPIPIAVLECQRCAGLWMGLEALEELLSAEARGGKPGVGHLPETAREAPPAARGYRPCVMCGELMSRRNLARGKSGVVVDLCGRHGVWFDSDELAQLIAWSRTGGLEELRRDLARLAGSKDKLRKRHALQDDSPRKRVPAAPPDSVPPVYSADAEWIFLAGQLAGQLLGRKIFR